MPWPRGTAESIRHLPAYRVPVTTGGPTGLVSVTEELHAALGPIGATRMTLEAVKAFLRGWFPHWQMQLRAFDAESLLAWGLVLLAGIWTVRTCTRK